MQHTVSNGDQYHTCTRDSDTHKHLLGLTTVCQVVMANGADMAQREAPVPELHEPADSWQGRGPNSGCPKFSSFLEKHNSTVRAQQVHDNSLLSHMLLPQTQQSTHHNF